MIENINLYDVDHVREGIKLTKENDSPFVLLTVQSGTLATNFEVALNLEELQKAVAKLAL